ncbi:MAG: hypothetical protein V3V27_00495 [Candidatus Thermoplasmatota archaeon]
MKIFVSLCFISSTFFINTASAEDASERLVDATFTIEFVTGTNLVVDVTMTAYKLTTDHAYTAEEIASASDEEMGALKLSIYLLLKNQINIVFGDAKVSNFEMPTYSSGVFNEELNVKLTSAFFGLNDSVDSESMINGVLDMGAVITYNFNLVTELGWNNTFTCVLPDSINFTSANTDNVSLNRKEITWILNWNGADAEKSATLSTRLKNPTTTLSETEDIFLTFDLDSSNVNNVSLTTTFSLRNTDIREYDILPDFITELGFVPSDGIRLFIDNSLLSWNDLYQNTIKPVEQTTISTIEHSSFNQTLTMLFNWDSETSTNCTTPYNTTNMDDVPVIKAELTSEDPIELLLCDVSSRAFFGLVNAGAVANISEEDINFGDKLDEIGRSYEVLLHLPTEIYLEGDNIYRWNESISLSGVFSSDLQPLPKYSEENINTYIEIDISKLDLNIPSFFTGKAEFTATAHSKEDIHVSVTRFPMEFGLSDKINLPYLNSDAFRVCVDESVFSTEEVDAYLSNKKDVFEMRMSNVLNGLEIKGVVDKDVFSDSLSWDKDISHMDDVIPIVASTYANNLYPISFSFSLWPPDMHISNQTFTFESIKNQTVTYRIEFPKGISVTATDTLNKSILKGKTTDGREYIEVFFASDEEAEIDTITCVLVASSLYMLGQFLPCIISLALVVILIIVVYILKRKRRGRKLVIQEEVDASGYEGEDFYVPPPPSSK